MHDVTSKAHSLNAKWTVKSRRVLLEIDRLLRKFVRVTENIDNITHIINEHGLDRPDPHVRFRVVQSIPDLVVENFLKNVNIKRASPAANYSGWSRRGRGFVARARRVRSPV